MANKVGYVNVGALINPVDGVSRSLTNLSNMYGKQASEQANKIARENDLLARKEKDRVAQNNIDASNAESKRRFEITQNAANSNRLQKNKELLAKRQGNELFIGINEGRAPKFKDDDFDSEWQEEFGRLRSSFDLERKGYLDYLETGNVDDLDNAIRHLAPKDTNIDNKKAIASMEQRKRNLQTVYRATQDPANASKVAEIRKKAMDDIFLEKERALEKSIEDGVFLTNRQKAKAYIRHAPEEFRNNGNAPALFNSLVSSMTGNTKQDLKSGEASRVSTFNDGVEKRNSAKVKAYKSAIAAKKKEQDWSKIGKLIGEDYGSSDNKNKENIIDKMISAGIPHSRIDYAVRRLTNTGWIDSKSIPDADSDEVVGMIATIKSDIEKDGHKLNKPIEFPELDTPTASRSLHEIQMDILKGSTGRSTGAINIDGVLSRYKEAKSTAADKPSETVTTPNDSVPPDKPIVEEYVPDESNNFYTDVPRGSNEVIPKNEQDWIDKREESYNSLGSKFNRFGRDAMFLMSRLNPVASAAVPLTTTIRAGALGSKLPLAVKNKQARDYVSEVAYKASQAAKEKALNPVRQVLDPVVRSKSEIRVDNARKKAWNNDKVEKEITEMWDNYWMANVKR